MGLNLKEMETFLEQDISPAQLAESLDNAIFNLMDNHLELQGEPVHRQLQNQVHNLKRLRDICARLEKKVKTF